ncbi:MAG: hypothetical protein P8O05_09075 [Flavobacteriales bacterium]|nr:hypothetical protein [Flavobacteriales bacterium]MDG2244955.1 hypothetical protein [Flavobacteriales bacterium]
MKRMLFVFLPLLLSACAPIPAQRFEMQQDVMLNYDWWNNLVEQPVIRVQLWNTTPENYTGFTLDICAWDEAGEEIVSFRTYKAFDLLGGEKKTFRMYLPGRNANDIEISLVETH